LNDFEDQLMRVFRGNLPMLPQNINDNLVKFLPWIFIVFGILGLVTSLSALDFLSHSGWIMMGMGYVGASYITCFFALIVQALAVAGGYFMLTRQLKGWRIALYSGLLHLVGNILTFSIFGLLLSLIGIYLLFQIRESYN